MAGETDRVPDEHIEAEPTDSAVSQVGACRNRRIARFAGALIVGFAAFNVAQVWGFGWGEWQDVLITFCVIGAVVGQIYLVSLWAALANANYVVRISSALTLLAYLCYSLLTGWMLRDWLGDAQGASTIGLCLLYGAIALGGVLWLARARGWRLLGPHETAASRGRLQFGIRHLLLATLFVALALAPFRFFFPDPAVPPQSDEQILVPMIVAALGTHLMVTIGIWPVMRRRSGQLRTFAFLWALYCLLVSVVECAAIYAMFGRQGGGASEARELFVSTVFLNGTQCATVFVPLLIFRRLGVRLVNVRREFGVGQASRDTNREPSGTA